MKLRKRNSQLENEIRKYRTECVNRSPEPEIILQGKEPKMISDNTKHKKFDTRNFSIQSQLQIHVQIKFLIFWKEYNPQQQVVLNDNYARTELTQGDVYDRVDRWELNFQFTKLLETVKKPWSEVVLQWGSINFKFGIAILRSKMAQNKQHLTK